MDKEFFLEDKKVDCISFLHTVKASKYLESAEDAYKNKGGIKGQRTPLKTKTAQTIRRRMVTDICSGAVLPPLVVGVIVKEEIYSNIKNSTSESEIINLIENKELGLFSIIDGMQRTTALLEAQKIDSNVNDSFVRIEYWIAKNMNSLIYRMLVLNTGQVPWDIKRQLDTIYDPILEELSRDIPELDIKLLDNSGRRTNSGQYQSSKLIEYFLCFTSRKIDIDLKDKVAEDFARMDVIAATSDNKLLDDFKVIIRLMVQLDHQFARANVTSEHIRFKAGKDIFTSMPAGVGFIASAGVYIYGPPGLDSDSEEVLRNISKLKHDIGNFCEKLKQLNREELITFLEFDLLNEKLSAKSSKVGTFEREFFFKAFEALFKYSEKLTNLKACWSAR